ncbi:hydroxyisourate hydrolase [Streptomyces tsukubensis]|uniref:hydroxyisourate hydrolase n=1 Tax=Streptomyces tsukubensis TaxID=83656 RepID=UPI0036C14CEE
MSTQTTASVSTHILDTSIGRPAAGVPVRLSARPAEQSPWTEVGASATDADGRCKDLPAPPEGTILVRLEFGTEEYFLTGRAESQRSAPEHRAGGPGPVFFPEVAIVFAVEAGEHYHVPLLLNPFGYSVYRGS